MNKNLRELFDLLIIVIVCVMGFTTKENLTRILCALICLVYVIRLIFKLKGGKNDVSTSI